MGTRTFLTILMDKIKYCTTCRKNKLIDEFYLYTPHPSNNKIYIHTKCKECFKQYRKKSEEKSPGITLLINSKSRAKKKGIIWNLDISDISIPSNCPICGCNVFSAKGKTNFANHSPTLDRVVPSLGYVKGNVAVICAGCNTIKNFGDADRHRKIADYIDLYTNKKGPRRTPSSGE